MNVGQNTWHCHRHYMHNTCTHIDTYCTSFWNTSLVGTSYCSLWRSYVWVGTGWKLCLDVSRETWRVGGLCNRTQQISQQVCMLHVLRIMRDYNILHRSLTCIECTLELFLITTGLRTWMWSHKSFMSWLWLIILITHYCDFMVMSMYLCLILGGNWIHMYMWYYSYIALFDAGTKIIQYHLIQLFNDLVSLVPMHLKKGSLASVCSHVN